jgi:Rrf2 family protein
MLLTRASEYALLSLDKIRRSDRPVGAEHLAQELCIPKSFLAKILQSLARDNIIVSHRGAHGGFALERELNTISVYDIVLAAEGKAASVFDCTQYQETCPNGTIGDCAISPFLTRFQMRIDLFLRELTLDQIFKENEPDT